MEEQERKGAEIDYLKLYGPEWRKSGGNQDPAKNNPSAEFQSRHPRFQALVDSQCSPLFLCLSEDRSLFQTLKSISYGWPVRLTEVASLWVIYFFASVGLISSHCYVSVVAGDLVR